MKTVMVLLAMLVVAGCSHKRVTVDMDSCHARGEVDGVRVAECQKVSLDR
jgi:hypothetical protein